MISTWICAVAALGAAGDPPTYAGAVAAVLDRRCVGCHRPGRVAPFALTSYRQAARRASSLLDAIEGGRMPPWHAAPGFGPYKHDPRLTDLEREQVRAWVLAGCPEGNPAQVPPPTPRPDDWEIGRPDLVVAMPRPFAIPAAGVVDYQTFEVDPGAAADRWVRAVEVRPGNRRAVHHASVYLSPPGAGAMVATQGELGSFCLAAMTPGNPAATYPAGMAKRIPAGWRLILVVHYAPTGAPAADRTSVGLAFADPKAVRREVATNLLVDPDLAIPPGSPDHRVERSRRFEADVLLLAMFPHMHARGRSFRYDAIDPDGRIETLLHVPRFDIGWQARFELAEPRRLPAGTTLRCVAHYDNSAANPANPAPAALVRAGPQNSDEMFNGYYDFALLDQDLTAPAAPRLAGAAWLATAGLAGALLLVRRRGRPTCSSNRATVRR